MERDKTSSKWVLTILSRTPALTLLHTLQLILVSSWAFQPLSLVTDHINQGNAAWYSEENALTNSDYRDEFLCVVGQFCPL